MEKKVYLYLNTTGITRNTQIISFAMVDTDDNRFYVEYNDYDPTSVNEEIYNDIVVSLLFNEYQNIKTFNEENNTMYMKDDFINIQVELLSFLYKISDGGKIKLQFVLENNMDWFVFLTHAFNDDRGIPMIPDFIKPASIELTTLFVLTGIDPFIGLDTIIGNGIESNTNALVKVQQLRIIEEIYSFKAVETSK